MFIDMKFDDRIELRVFTLKVSYRNIEIELCDEMQRMPMITVPTQPMLTSNVFFSIMEFAEEY